jgi:ABC-2 type transport system permease protein
MSFVTRAFGLAGTLATFFFIGRIVDPDQLAAYGGRYFEFVLIGMMVGAISSVGLRSFTDTISAEQSSGTLEVLLVTPTGLPTLFAGALLVPLGFVLLESSIILLVSVSLLGAHLQVGGLLTAALALPPTLAFFAAVGACSAAFIVVSKRGDPVTPVFTQLSNLLAGALFPVAVLPGALQAVAKVFPPYYSLRVIRGGLLNGSGITDVWGDYLVLVGSAAIALPLSLVLFRAALRTARETGTLGTY